MSLWKNSTNPLASPTTSPSGSTDVLSALQDIANLKERMLAAEGNINKSLTNLKTNFSKLTTAFDKLAFSGSNLAEKISELTTEMNIWKSTMVRSSQDIAQKVAASGVAISNFIAFVNSIDANRYVATVAILPSLGGPTITFLTRPGEFATKIIEGWRKGKDMSDSIKGATDSVGATFSSEAMNLSNVARKFNDTKLKFDELSAQMAGLKDEFSRLFSNL